MATERKSRMLWTIPLLITVSLISFPAYAKYNGGTGEPNDPYQITTANDLMLLGETPDDCDKHFILTADIDLAPNLPGRKVFDKAVIGYFTGVFDGNGQKISHLTIIGRGKLGLFGWLGYKAKIINLGLRDIVVNGIDEDVSGLVGISFGTVANSYSTGTVSGFRSVGGLVGSSGVGGQVSRCYSDGMVCGDEDVGGLVGGNWGGSVLNCYSLNSTNGDESVGGLVGSNSGDVTNCYSAGIVIGRNEVGGLVGRGSPDYVSTSFWDIQTSGQTASAGGEGKATAEMQTAGLFLEAGWDLVGEAGNGMEDIWWIQEGLAYPMLRELPGDCRLAPLPAFCPEPKIGATDVIQSPILSWVPGGSGLQYDVYFGEDELTVASATTESAGIYCGRQLPEITIYEPGYLQWGKTYYWRIDGISEADPNNPWKNNVWNFTTATFIVVDDFESYNDLDRDDPESNWIYETWIDGWDNPNNGSLVGIDVPPWVDLTIAHSGMESMSFLYDNSGPAYYSEASMTLTYPRDWTQEGVGVLSLWFGDLWPWSCNTPESMYVALANTGGPTAVVYHNNPDATTIKSWTEWTIDLQAFAEQGVNLNDINAISIGFGNRNNPQPGGAGYMYFDDIRLYRP